MKRYYKRKEAGLCVACGKENTRRYKVLCKKCGKKVNASQKNHRKI